MDNQEDWYGHKFKKINDTIWKCDCGEKIYSCIPEGYVLVPIEPTITQSLAGMRAIDANGGEGDDDSLITDAVEAYKAMIAAAQDKSK